jgi:hypothetical protein
MPELSLISASLVVSIEGSHVTQLQPAKAKCCVELRSFENSVRFAMVLRAGAA